ncbi:MAG: ABC transporter permease [Acidimicrobiaceae bacterium]|nr:ABC transporter permease [Acidimicrobiaceae bacterium]
MSDFKPSAVENPEIKVARADDAQIIDRGYRPYEGLRTGLPQLISSVVVYSAKYVLGIGRKFRYKIFPAIALIIAIFPALVFVGLSFVPDWDLQETDILPAYHLYYEWPMVIAIVMFISFGVPDILVADRRNGMMDFYFSTPLRLWSYLTSKVLAVFVTMLIITITPILLLLVAYVQEDAGPSGVDEWLILLARILLGGIAAAGIIAATTMTIASFVDRRGLAAASVLLLLLGSAFLTTILARGGTGAWVYSFNIPEIYIESVNRIYGVLPEYVFLGEGIGSAGLQSPGVTPTQLGVNPVSISDLSTLLLVLSYVGWIALSSAAIWFRYRRLVVSR